MMKLGMLIDVDHMSDRTRSRTIELAERVPGGYPLVMGHNGLRGPGGNERSAPPEAVSRIAALDGLFGVGTANTTPAEFVANFAAVWPVMAERGVAVGTDANGFEQLPRHTRSTDSRTSDSFYARFFAPRESAPIR